MVKLNDIVNEKEKIARAQNFHLFIAKAELEKSMHIIYSGKAKANVPPNDPKVMETEGANATYVTALINIYKPATKNLL